MPFSECNFDCLCGQPLDMVVTSSSAHCPRCGRIVSIATLTDPRNGPGRAASLLVAANHAA
jgi:hypothetical protein